MEEGKLSKAVHNCRITGKNRRGYDFSIYLLCRKVKGEFVANCEDADRSLGGAFLIDGFR